MAWNPFLACFWLTVCWLAVPVRHQVLLHFLHPLRRYCLCLTGFWFAAPVQCWAPSSSCPRLYLHAVRFTRISLLQYVRVAVGHSINDFACCTRLGVATTATCIVAGSQSLLLSALSSSSSWLPMLCCVRGFGGVISLPSQEEQLLPSKYISH